ncbi:copper amine oxidase N-terminal domain-containing protein [Paenibacillus thiaminolyticus]|nr:copper amine oxidase N-terminal domain-containing protein [Paenibacillus thiaminolyticus]
MKNSKIILVSLITVLVLSFPLSIGAKAISSVVGKKVTKQTEVLYGKKVILKDAITVEGRTYAPVREFAQFFGMEVGNVDGKLSIYKSKNRLGEPELTERNEKSAESLLNSIKDSEKYISNLEAEISANERFISRLNREKSRISDFKEILDREKVDTKDYNNKIDNDAEFIKKEIGEYESLNQKLKSYLAEAKEQLSRTLKTYNEVKSQK